MTESIDLFALAIDTTRRDRWGRYVVLPPGMTDPVGYTRVTTVAKSLDSGGGLAPWKAAMASTGVIMRPGLRAQWEALLNEYPDPWYASEASKAACKKLVEECAAAGGANDRREIGSAFHAITALADAGKTIEHLTPETRADLDAYVSGMALVSADVDPQHLEEMVVLDEYRVAGTFDRIVTLPGFPMPMIADLKTGADLSYSYQSIAVQLAAYAHADNIYVQGQAADGSADLRYEMPEVDQRYALIIWLDAGSAQLKLIVVDIARGWEAFHLSMAARAWRSTRDLAIPLAEFNYDLQGTAEQDIEAVLEASLAEHGIEVAEKQTVLHSVPSEAGTMAAAQSNELVRLWLQERINVIGRHDEARTMLGVHWPADLPPLKRSDAHTAEQLAAIEVVLDGVERAYELGFPSRKP